MRKSNLERLSHQFVEQVLRALRTATVDELAEVLPQVKKLADQRGRDPNRALRSPRETADVVNQVLELLVGFPEGLRSEELQRKLGVHAARMRLAIVDLVRQGRVVRQGRARGVRYVLAADSGGPGKGKRQATPGGGAPSEGTLLSLVRARLEASSAPLTASGLEELVGQSKELVRVALEQLADGGEVERLAAGRYRLAGRAEVDGLAATNGSRMLRRRPLAAGFSSPNDIGAGGAELGRFVAILATVIRSSR